MKANELRIGNWITNKNSMYTSEQVKVINGQWINNSPEDNFNGINLTEEWLLKFGFQLQGLKHYWLDPMLLIFYVDGTIYLANQRHVNIYYVHQLQNLYFALTGKELTV